MRIEERSYETFTLTMSSHAPQESTEMLSTTENIPLELDTNTEGNMP
jgi:hypothetical protein